MISSMDSKVCVASLLLLALLSTPHGTVIPSEVGRVFQKVQDVLVNDDTFATALGLRVKRDTVDWDKEFDMEALGISFKIKFVDSSDPFLGGQAYLKFPGHRFVKAANFDDVELKLDFKGSNGQFNVKIEYKYIQKFRNFADRPQRGVVIVSAMTHHGSINNFKMSLERNATKEFEIDADGEFSDGGIKLHGQVNFGHSNVWQMFIDLSSRSINFRFIQNSLEYSVSADSFYFEAHMWKVYVQITHPGHTYFFQLEHSYNYPKNFMLNITGEFNQPFAFEASTSMDGTSGLASGKLWLYIGGKTYVLVDLAGESRFIGFFPTKKRYVYVATYSFIDWTNFTTEGKAMIHFDGFNGLSNKKLITIDYTENNGKKGNFNMEIDHTNSGFKHLMDINHDGRKILKQKGVGNITTDTAEVWEATNVLKTEADETSPFYKLYCYYMYPVPCTTSMQTTRKSSIHRITSNYLYEEETLHGVEKISSMKIDTTSTPLSFTWEVIKAPDLYPFEGKIDWTAEEKPALSKPMHNSDPFRLISMFKFEKDGKTILWQNLDCEIGIWGIENMTLDYQLDEDFYKFNKWFGNLIHPIHHWKRGRIELKFLPPFMVNVDMFLNIQLDSLNYDIMLLPNGKNNLGIDKIKLHIPVAPEWCPLEGEFDYTFKDDLARSGWVNGTYTYKHGGKTYWEGQHNSLIQRYTRHISVMNYGKIDLDENSLIYAKLCGESYPVNCSNDYEYETRFYIDSRNTTTMDLHLETKQDGETAHLFKIDAMNRHYQLVWYQPESSTGILKKMFGINIFEVTADYEAGKELVVISNLAEMNLTMRNEPNLFMEFKRYGETYLKFSHQKDKDYLAIETMANLYIPCVQQSYFDGCYNKWEGELNVFVDLKNKNVYINKHSINAVIKKDMEIILEVEQATNVSPYVLKIKSPQGEFDCTFKDDHESSGWVNGTYTYKHAGKTYWEGQHNSLIQRYTRHISVMKYGKIAIDENSLIYAKLCGESYPVNCSNNYEYETRFYIDSRNTTIMDLHLETKHDGKTAHLFKIDAMNKPFQLVWYQPESSTGILKKMFGTDILEVTADYEAGKELVVISNLAEMNLTMRKEPNLFMEFKRYGETYLKFSHQKDQDHLAIETMANLYIPCVQQSYFDGCYNKWEGELNVFVDLKNKNVYLNKHSINAVVKKDMEVILDVEQATNVSPYVFKIKASHLINMLFDDPNKHSLDLTIEHQEGKLLHIQTNHPEIRSFKIIEQSKLELNGKQLVDYKLSDNQLTVTYQLPGGQKIHLQVVCSGWNQWMNPKNQGSLKIETPAETINLNVDYDVTDIKNGQMMMDVHGENPKIGKYEFLHKVHWNMNSAKVGIAWDGKAQLEKGPLAMFSPIATKAHVDFDVTNMIFTANIDKEIAGQKWRFEVNDNKVKLTSQ